MSNEQMSDSTEKFIDFVSNITILKSQKEQIINPKNLVNFKAMKPHQSSDFSEMLQEFIDSMANTELVINSKKMQQVTDELRLSVLVVDNNNHTLTIDGKKIFSKDSVYSRELDYTTEGQSTINANNTTGSRRILLSSKNTKDFDSPSRIHYNLDTFNLEEFIKLKENSNFEQRDSTIRQILTSFVHEIQEIQENIISLQAQERAIEKNPNHLNRTDRSRLSRHVNFNTYNSKPNNHSRQTSDLGDGKNILMQVKQSETIRSTSKYSNSHSANCHAKDLVLDGSEEKSEMRTEDKTNDSKMMRNVCLQIEKENPYVESSDELYELNTFFNTKSIKTEIALWEGKLQSKERKFETLISKILKIGISMKAYENSSIIISYIH
jgi:hypothetical protein